ncbi:MAG: hypothetical protein ACE5OZ_18385 [Candidatus Heimdallarchaeota archaeon]
MNSYKSQNNQKYVFKALLVYWSLLYSIPAILAVMATITLISGLFLALDPNYETFGTVGVRSVGEAILVIIFCPIGGYFSYRFFRTYLQETEKGLTKAGKLTLLGPNGWLDRPFWYLMAVLLDVFCFVMSIYMILDFSKSFS